MLPVVVSSVKEQRAGLFALTKFIREADRDIQKSVKQMEQQRREVCSQLTCRRDRMAAHRYFDLGRRSQKAYQEAIDAMKAYLESGEESLLNLALRQFETGERFGKARLEQRVRFAPNLCDRFARAC